MSATVDAPEQRRTRLGTVGPVLADLACVLAFALAGKGSHEPGAAASVVLAIVWPFAVAVLVAHAGLHLTHRVGSRLWPAGVVVLATTFVLGMALRVASGRGIAVSFLVVALIFLAVTLLGWRLVVRLVTARRARG